MSIDPATAAGAPHAAPEPEASSDWGRHHEHFHTEHLRTNIRQRAISSGFITLMAQGSRMALYVASTVILRHMLAVEDFGLLAMVFTVTGFLLLFKDAGFSTATIQTENITQAQVSNLFWINVALGAVLSVIVAASSFGIARFYHNDQRLIGMTMALSVTFVLGGMNIQHQALLNRQMRFKATAVIDIGSMAASLITGVAMAWLGCRYWSLVGAQLAMSITETILTWSVSTWRPQLPSRSQGTWTMLGFGGSLTATNLLRRLASQAANVLLGKVYDAGTLALYTTGWSLLMRPLEQVLAPFDTVFLPLLSRMQDQPVRYRRTYLQVYNALALISFPVAALFMGLSHPLVLTLLGHKWEGSAPVFAAFTVSAISYPVGGASMWLLTTQGRGKDFFVAGSIVSVISVISYVIGLPFGPVGVAWSFSLAGLAVRLPIQYHIIGRSGPVGTRDLWSVFLKYLPMFFMVLLATWATLKLTPDASPIIQLIAGGFSGLVASFACVAAVKEQRALARKLYQSIFGFLTNRLANTEA